MSYRKFILFSFALAAIGPMCSADDVVAFRGATVETVAKAGTIENATIVVRDGKIAAVGKASDVEVPTDARTVDLANRTVMPALVDLYHPITVAGVSTSTGSRTIVFNGRTFTIPGSRSTSAPTWVKLSDMVDPLSLESDYRRLSRTGVGFANIVSRGYGHSLQTRVTPDSPADAIVNANGTVFLSLSNATAVLDVLRKGLKSSSSRSSGSSSSASSSSSTTSLWAAVREGKSPLILNVNNAATIMYLLEICDQHPKVRFIMIASAADLYQTMDELKKHKLSIVVKAGIDTAPQSYRRINIAKMLHDAKLDFGFSPSLDSSLASMPDTPLFPLSMLVKTGLPKEAALKGITLAPAKMLGLERSLGSIEVGKQANLLVLDGEPFDAATTVQQLLVEGKSVYVNQ